MQNIDEIDELIKLISKLPGLGPKSARRIILKLINNRNELMKPMLTSLNNVFKNILRCQSCGTLKSIQSGCSNCENIKKKYNKICVVENIADQWSIENSSIYEGYFHILGGTISTSNSNRKEDLLIESLIKRVKNENIEELIRSYNFRYNIKKIEKIASFELKSFILRSYYHNNILAFGDLLHKIHPLAGQGFNMSIRDLRVLLELIEKKLNLGLSLDSSINYEFDKITRHKNFIFSNGIDLIHEFFNFERKYKNNTISKSVQFIGKNPILNKMFTNIADKGFVF